MFERKFSPARRHLVFLDPSVMRILVEERNGWHETAEDIRDGLQWGRRKARLLRWVRQRMLDKLTKRERECIELYYFRGKSYPIVARLTGTNTSSAYRAVQRGLRKLRAAAMNEGLIRRNF